MLDTLATGADTGRKATSMTAETISAETVLEQIRQHTESENPSSFLAVNEGNEYFTAPGLPGVVVYRSTGRYLVQFGGPFAPRESYLPLLAAFKDFADGCGQPIVAVQLQDHDARLYARHGFTVNQIGASYAVDLDAFTLAGSKFMQLRNKISRAFRNGLTVTEAPLDTWQQAMRAIDGQWLSGKGEQARPLEFLVGQYGGAMQSHRRLFVGTVDGELVGYISYSPVHGERAGWMHDLSRRRPDGSPGIMEAINKTAMDVFHSEGTRWLHFGFTPFTGLRAECEPEGASPAFGWLMQFLREHGEAVYPAATQLAYKLKWAPQLVLPEYVAFQGRAGIGAFVHIFRAANAL